MVYDLKLLVINEKREIGVIHLSHPFLQFCMHLQHSEFNNCLEICKQFDPALHYLFAKMLIHRNALSFAILLSGLSPIDKLVIQLENENNM